MKLALMQPYLFPYIGYFALIVAVDRWVVFDEAQFIKAGWIHRNRILKPGGGWQYLGVPLRKFPSTATIGEVAVADDPKWRRRLVGQLQHYARAPHYRAVLELVHACLDPPVDRIVDLNERSLAATCAYLGLPFASVRLSHVAFDRAAASGPGDWGRLTCAALGATTYVNPVGGRALFDPAAYAADGIAIRFLQAREVPYDQGRTPFEPWLSILDVLMFNDPAAVRQLCAEVTLT